MDETHWAAVEHERLTLADLLEGLTPQQWESPSLCAKWRVKDVAAHVAMTPTAPSVPTVLAALTRAGGNLWAAGAAIAIDHARRPSEQIVHELRRDAAARTMPRFTNPENLLLDVLVHGQDIAIPLGIDRPMPTAAAQAGFERVWVMGWPFWAQKRMRGIRLIATDAPVDVGDGPPVQGRLADLLLLITGRTETALARLHGEGTTLLSTGRPAP
jgi:uncharacterized protein (TIGR03083 family)